MLFITVGTHEQQFNRLVRFVDRLKNDGVITEDVIMQTGYSTYEPMHCSWRKLFPYNDMLRYVAEARIVITHGGPSSFVMPLQLGKIPIVVPRKKIFDEHVNDHQVMFCKAVAEKQRNIITVDNIEELPALIKNYDEIIAGMSSGLDSNNIKFCTEFEKMVGEILKY